jgi:RNase P subunit RPR2
MPQTPSERIHSGRKARVRSASRPVVRCADCREIYDVIPTKRVVPDVNSINPRTGEPWYEVLDAPCTKCGGTMFYPARVKD